MEEEGEEEEEEEEEEVYYPCNMNILLKMCLFVCVEV